MITKISPLLIHEITSFLTIESNNYFCTCKATSALGKEVGKLVKRTLEKTVRFQKAFGNYNLLQTQKVVRFIARHVTFTCSAPRLYVVNDHLPVPIWTYNKNEILVSLSERPHSKGATKVAYRCFNLRGEERCLLETDIKDADVAKRYKKELEISRMVSGKKGFLTTYATFCRGPKMHYMVQEFVSYDLLDFYTTSWPDLYFKQRVALLKTMSIALQFLHTNNIIHGDISLLNFLCDGSKVCLIDFDMSSKPGENDPYIGNCAFVPPDIVTHILKGDLKTQNALLSDFPNDIWRLGLVMGILMRGKLRWEDGPLEPIKVWKRIAETMASNELPFVLDTHENSMLVKLIYSMVNKEASKRPSIEAVIKELDEIEEILKAGTRKRRVDSDDD